MDKKLTCPFCGKEVRIAVCDDEGNIHPYGYEHTPWNGLGYMLVHEKEVKCPPLGRVIYGSRKAAIEMGNKRHPTPLKIEVSK